MLRSWEEAFQVRRLYKKGYSREVGYPSPSGHLLKFFVEVIVWAL